jgi:hypothetical protein
MDLMVVSISSLINSSLIIFTILEKKYILYYEEKHFVNPKCNSLKLCENAYLS